METEWSNLQTVEDLHRELQVAIVVHKLPGGLCCPAIVTGLRTASISGSGLNSLG